MFQCSIRWQRSFTLATTTVEPRVCNLRFSHFCWNNIKQFAIYGDHTRCAKVFKMKEVGK